jgi:hypothetical protein
MNNSDYIVGHVASIIGLEDTQSVYVFYWPWKNRFHANGREDIKIERLIDYIHDHWNDKCPPDDGGRLYRSQMDYACGYRD